MRVGIEPLGLVLMWCKYSDYGMGRFKKNGAGCRSIKFLSVCVYTITPNITVRISLQAYIYKHLRIRYMNTQVHVFLIK